MLIVFTQCANCGQDGKIFCPCKIPGDDNLCPNSSALTEAQLVRYTPGGFEAYRQVQQKLVEKRLEEDKFSWPRKMHGTTLSLSQEQWQWLLDGLDIEKMKPHRTLDYQSLS